MKLFHISFFVADRHIHDVMTALEWYKVRELEVKTVKSTEKAAKETTGKRPKPTRGEYTARFMEATAGKTNMTKEEIKALGVAPASFGMLTRYGYIKKLKNGTYNILPRREAA